MGLMGKAKKAVKKGAKRLRGGAKPKKARPRSGY